MVVGFNSGSSTGSGGLFQITNTQETQENNDSTASEPEFGGFFEDRMDDIQDAAEESRNDAVETGIDHVQEEKLESGIEEQADKEEEARELADEVGIDPSEDNIDFSDAGEEEGDSGDLYPNDYEGPDEQQDLNNLLNDETAGNIFQDAVEFGIDSATDGQPVPGMGVVTDAVSDKAKETAKKMADNEKKEDEGFLASLGLIDKLLILAAGSLGVKAYTERGGDS